MSGPYYRALHIAQESFHDQDVFLIKHYYSFCKYILQGVTKQGTVALSIFRYLLNRHFRNSNIVTDQWISIWGL